MPPTEQQQGQEVIRIPEPTLLQKLERRIVDAPPLEQGGLALMVIAAGLLVGLPYHVKSRRGGILAGIAAVILGACGYLAFDSRYLLRHRALYGVSDEIRAECERLLQSPAPKLDERRTGEWIWHGDPNFPASLEKIRAVNYGRPHPEMVMIMMGDQTFSSVGYLYDPHRLHTKLKKPEFPMRGMWYRDFYVFVAPGE